MKLVGAELGSRLNRSYHPARAGSGDPCAQYTVRKGKEVPPPSDYLLRSANAEHAPAIATVFSREVARLGRGGSVDHFYLDVGASGRGFGWALLASEPTCGLRIRAFEIRAAWRHLYADSQLNPRPT